MPHMPAALQHMDMSWFTAVHSVSSPALDWASNIVSTLTWGGWCWWVLAGILWYRGHRFFATQLAVALIIGSVEGEALKHILHRLRPSFMFPQDVHMIIPDPFAGKWSFPSGHTLLAATAAIVIAWRTRDWKAALALLVPFVVAFARVYEGVHWPLDTIAGIAFGAAAGVVGILVSNVFASSPIFRTEPASSRRLQRFSLQSKS